MHTRPGASACGLFLDSVDGFDFPGLGTPAAGGGGLHICTLPMSEQGRSEEWEKLTEEERQVCPRAPPSGIVAARSHSALTPQIEVEIALLRSKAMKLRMQRELQSQESKSSSAESAGVDAAKDQGGSQSGKKKPPEKTPEQKIAELVRGASKERRVEMEENKRILRDAGVGTGGASTWTSPLQALRGIRAVESLKGRLVLENLNESIGRDQKLCLATRPPAAAIRLARVVRRGGAEGSDASPSAADATCSAEPVPLDSGSLDVLANLDRWQREQRQGTPAVAVVADVGTPPPRAAQGEES